MKQIIEIAIHSESWCNIHSEEYSSSITGIIGGLDLNENGGESDYHLIKNCIDEWVDENSGKLGSSIDDEININLIIESKYERQDVFFVKWFDVIESTIDIN